MHALTTNVPTSQHRSAASMQSDHAATESFARPSHFTMILLPIVATVGLILIRDFHGESVWYPFTSFLSILAGLSAAVTTLTFLYRFQQWEQAQDKLAAKKAIRRE